MKTGLGLSRFWKTAACLCVVAALLTIWQPPPTTAQAPQQAAPPDFIVEEHVAIPMRDGVNLQADVWRPNRPTAGDAKFPTLVYRTPYNRKRAATGDISIFHKAVERGYAVVMVDVRGRYGSGGEYLPYQQEGKDGYDTIEWAAAQKWSDGSIGTFGLSYPGAVQWLAAMERPPHLKAMVPAMTFSTPTNFFYSGGVFDLSWVYWIWQNIAPDVRAKKNLPGPQTAREARAEWDARKDALQKHLPLGDLADLKQISPWYYEWMKHPPGDPWWEWCELRGKYDRIPDVAVLNFSGWYDDAYGPEGATTNFSGLVKARGGDPAKSKTALVMGPWPHGVPGPDDTKAGARDFGSAAAIDYDAMVLDWMDRHLRGISRDCEKDSVIPSAARNPSSKIPADAIAKPTCGWPVRYFVVGPNEWREAPTWPLPQTRNVAFFLGGVAGTGKPGSLNKDKPGGGGESYSGFISDPANPVPDKYPPYTGGNDYAFLEKQDGVLVFDTEPLAEDTEVTGHITAEIWLASDAPDTDLWVRLLDVSPDGKAISLMSPGLDVVRASYRNGGPKRELLRPWRPVRVALPNLITSNVFKKGHRIRVQISATFFPNFSRNLHSGQLETESAEMRKATIRIHHDKSRPSRIILPIIPARAEKKD